MRHRLTQQSCYCLCKINIFPSFMVNPFEYLRHLRAGKWQKTKLLLPGTRPKYRGKLPLCVHIIQPSYDLPINGPSVCLVTVAIAFCQQCLLCQERVPCHRPELLFTERWDTLTPDFVKFRSREILYWNNRTVLSIDRRLSSPAGRSLSNFGAIGHQWIYISPLRDFTRPVCLTV